MQGFRSYEIDPEKVSFNIDLAKEDATTFFNRLHQGIQARIDEFVSPNIRLHPDSVDLQPVMKPTFSEIVRDSKILLDTLTRTSDSE